MERAWLMLLMNSRKVRLSAASCVAKDITKPGEDAEWINMNFEYLELSIADWAGIFRQQSSLKLKFAHKSTCVLDLCREDIEAVIVCLPTRWLGVFLIYTNGGFECKSIMYLFVYVTNVCLNFIYLLS